MASDEGQNSIAPGVKGLVISVVGLIYLVFFILHVVRTLFGSSGFLELLKVPSDPVIGLVMFVVSILFFIGGYNILSGRKDGIAFSLIGSFMGILISMVNLLELLSNAFSAFVLDSPDLTAWNISDGIVPGLYLGLGSILILAITMPRRIARKPPVSSRGGRQK